MCKCSPLTKQRHSHSPVVLLGVLYRYLHVSIPDVMMNPRDIRAKGQEAGTLVRLADHNG